MPVERGAKSARRSTWVMIGAGVLFLLVAVSFTKELMRSYQIRKEIERLREDILTLQGQNTQMTDFVEYLKTDAYFEEQARLKLGLKADGEKLLVLTDTPEIVVSGKDAAPRSVAKSNAAPSAATNPQRWFRYFFGG